MAIKEGDAFRGDPQAIQGQTPHFWVVLAVYDSELGEGVLAVMVNATSNPADRTCVINKGDHPYFSHQSYVFYPKTWEFPVGEIEKMECLAPVSPELLSRIRRGLHASRLAPKRFKGIVPNR